MSEYLYVSECICARARMCMCVCVCGGGAIVNIYVCVSECVPRPFGCERARRRICVCAPACNHMMCTLVSLYLHARVLGWTEVSMNKLCM